MPVVGGMTNHATATEPRTTQAPDLAHDPRDHHRHLGPRRVRVDGQQDQRPRRRRQPVLRRQGDRQRARAPGWGSGAPVDISAGDRVACHGRRRRRRARRLDAPGRRREQHVHEHAPDDPWPDRGRGPGARDLPDVLRQRAGPDPRRRGRERGGPRFGHRAPARHQGRRHDDPAWRIVPGRRDPRAHADCPGHDRGRAARGGPAAVRQDAPPAGRGGRSTPRRWRPGSRSTRSPAPIRRRSRPRSGPRRPTSSR